MRNEIEERYFTWLLEKVTLSSLSIDPKNYTKLLTYLYERSFNYYILPMDGNRSEDGIDLRYSGFGYECNVDQHEIERYLDHRDCSMLEMMVALAVKAENIVGDSQFGDRTAIWFWYMVKSLDLLRQDDAHFNEYEVIFAIDCFINHDYKQNGKGGLFIVEDPPRDMRDVEIWKQMCWFLNENA
ncbi:MAG: hypothetical protein J6Y20_05550 [Lachnospiraceae bacterium]|nr:hypothetical protein [Lachnospiraceae bacterium]